ncbi:hypothetical protein [Hydrogenimonas sp.]
MSSKLSLLAAAFTLTSLLFTGCGGGGDTASTTLDTSVRTTITQQNAPVVAGNTIGAGNGSASTSPGIQSYSLDSAGEGSVALTIGKATLSVIGKESLHQAAAVRGLGKRESGSQQCTGGGSISFDISSDRISITYNNCIESGITINGHAETLYSQNGDITSTLTNLTIVSSEFDMNFIRATIKVTESGNHLYEKLTGTMVLKTGEYAGSYAYSDFEIDLSGINGSETILTLDGLTKTSCLGGWVDVTTTTPIKNAYDGCPYEGEVQIAGGEGSSLRIVFNSDMSVDLYVDGNTTPLHYNSCMDLPKGCEG